MRLGRNVLWNLAGFTWTSLAVIGATPIMVRGLGVEVFGVWSVLMAFVSYLATMDLGLGSALQRFLALESERRDPRRFEAVLRSGLSLQILIGAVAAGCFYFLGPIVMRRWLHIPSPMLEESIASVHLVSAGVFLAFPSAGYAAVPAVHHRFDLLAARWILFTTVQYGLFVLLLALGKGLYEITAAHVAATAVALTYLIAVSARLRSFRALVPGVSGPAVRDLLRFGRFKFPAQLALSFLQQFDRIALAMSVPAAQIAFYAVPLRLSQRVSQVVEPIVGPFYPAFAAHLGGERLGPLERAYRDGMRLIAGVLGAVVAVLAGLAFPILEVWVGREFAENGAWPLRILLVAYAAGALALLPSLASDAAGKPGIPSAALGAGAVVLAVLLFVLIPAFGLVGAALAALAAFSVPLFGAVPIIHRKVPGMPGLGPVLRELRGSTLAALTTFLLSLALAQSSFPSSGLLPLLVSLAGAFAGYFLLLFAFGGAAREDVTRFLGLFSRAYDAAPGN